MGAAARGPTHLSVCTALSIVLVLFVLLLLAPVAPDQILLLLLPAPVSPFKRGIILLVVIVPRPALAPLQPPRTARRGRRG